MLNRLFLIFFFFVLFPLPVFAVVISSGGGGAATSLVLATDPPNCAIGGQVAVGIGTTGAAQCIPVPPSATPPTVINLTPAPTTCSVGSDSNGILSNGDASCVADEITAVTVVSPLSSTGGTAPVISVLGLTGLGTAAQEVRVNAGGTALEYFTPPIPPASIKSLNGYTDDAQTLVTGTAGVDFNIASAVSGVHAFNVPDASPTARGAITFGAQTIAGQKTLTSTLIETAPITTVTLLTTSGMLGKDGIRFEQSVGDRPDSSMITTADLSEAISLGIYGKGTESFNRLITLYNIAEFEGVNVLLAHGSSSADFGRLLYDFPSKRFFVAEGVSTYKPVLTGTAIVNLNGAIGSTQTFPPFGALGTTPNLVTDPLNGSHTIHIPLASGLVTSGTISNSAQSLLGDKTLTGKYITSGPTSGLVLLDRATSLSPIEIYSPAANDLRINVDLLDRIQYKIQSGLTVFPGNTPAGDTGRINLSERIANGTNVVGLRAPDTMAADTIYNLPAAFPAVSGQVLSATTAGVMSWIPPTPFSLNGLTTNPQLFAVGSTGTAPNIVSAASTHTFNFPLAGSAVTSGTISNAAQTIGGQKDFSEPVRTAGLVLAADLTYASFGRDVLRFRQLAGDGVNSGKIQYTATGLSLFGFGPTVGSRNINLFDVVQMTNGESAAVSAPNTGRIRYNTTQQRWEESISGSGYVKLGSGSFTLNGLNASVQALGVGSTGTSPNVVSSGILHTVNIPLASPLVTSGTISNTTQFLSGDKHLAAKYIVNGPTGGFRMLDRVGSVNTGEWYAPTPSVVRLSRGSIDMFEMNNFGSFFFPLGVAPGATQPFASTELLVNGTSSTGWKAPDALATDIIYTLPSAFPTVSGQVLSGTTAGVTSWVTAPVTTLIPQPTAAATISITGLNLNASKTIKIKGRLLKSGGTGGLIMRFNNDAGAKYREACKVINASNAVNGGDEGPCNFPSNTNARTDIFLRYNDANNLYQDGEYLNFEFTLFGSTGTKPEYEGFTLYHRSFDLAPTKIFVFGHVFDTTMNITSMQLITDVGTIGGGDSVVKVFNE